MRLINFVAPLTGDEGLTAYALTYHNEARGYKEYTYYDIVIDKEGALRATNPRIYKVEGKKSSWRFWE